MAPKNLKKYENVLALWNLLGRPIILSSGEMVMTSPESVQIPIGSKMTDSVTPKYTLGIERGEGLYGQMERPDLMYPPDKDFRFTFSRNF